MPEERDTRETRLSAELMVEVCRALNFDPSEFAKRHGEEFTHLYLRLDGMLSYVGEEIVFYLAGRLNECLSKAEYALLSYIEYAGRAEKKAGTDCFSASVARYLHARKMAGTDWSYALSGRNPNQAVRCIIRRCMPLHRLCMTLPGRQKILKKWQRRTGRMPGLAREK